MLTLTLWLLTGCGVLDGRVNRAVDPADTEPLLFEVPAGSSARGLGPRLQEEGLIEEAWVWEYYLRSEKAGGCLKAGRFKLNRAMSMPEIMETLCGPPLADDVPFTVVEGWRIREIDAALAAEGWIEAGAYAAAANDPARFSLPFTIDGLSSLEGFLFPETYMVDPDKITAESFLQRQLDTFNEKFLAPAGDAVVERGLYPVVILASMVEREEPTPAKRALVAGILWKRLDSRWNLGVDATSRYTLAEWNDRGAFLKRLRDPNDPYNTRLRGGLPPTPIGNPGIDALNAAARPESSEYWYYLHDRDGMLHPTRNASEHEAMRRKYNVY
ncbi:MAG: endolytic transglycosylase MltG [Alphaproteobacteria bacterium]|nr:endolytic transglycosylase MltG [Alphaproteobacteria bacterium]